MVRTMHKIIPRCLFCTFIRKFLKLGREYEFTDLPCLVMRLVSKMEQEVCVLSVSPSNGERRKCNFWHFTILYVDNSLLV